MSISGEATLDTVAAPERLVEVLRFVAAHCGAPARDTRSVELVVEELFLNIAMHGSPNQPVRILCHPMAASLAAVELQYGGAAFDPAEAPLPDLDSPLAARRVGGLGLFLVHSLTDSVTYRREADLNRLLVRVRCGE